jgi:hypothetical protein
MMPSPFVKLLRNSVGEVHASRTAMSCSGPNVGQFTFANKDTVKVPNSRNHNTVCVDIAIDPDYLCVLLSLGFAQERSISSALQVGLGAEVFGQGLCRWSVNKIRFGREPHTETHLLQESNDA